MVMDARVYLTKKDRYAGTRKDAALSKKYHRAPLFRGGFTLCALAAAAPCVAAMGLPNSGSSGISNVRVAPRVMGWGVLFVLASAVHAAEIARMAMSSSTAASDSLLFIATRVASEKS